MRKKLLMSIVVIFCLTSTKAQEYDGVKEVGLKIINSQSSDVDTSKLFRTKDSKHFRDPKVPRFLLYDQQNKIAFGIGGYVRVRTAYDFNGSPSNSFGFIPNSIPVPKDPLTQNRFNIDASKSTLLFNIFGNNSQLGRFQAYVSGDFTDNNNTFQLSDAYIELLGFTVGRTWSTFNDLAAIPPTVDFQGPNGAAEMRTSQIRYSRTLAKNLSFGIGIELSQASGTYTSMQTAKTTQSLPDIPVYLQYSLGKDQNSHIRVAGVMLNMNYRDLLNNKTQTATGYGVQLSTKAVVNPVVQFYGQITYGQGIAEYINDLSGNGLSLVKDPTKNGKMSMQEALGWLTQIQFNLSKSVFTTLGYSQAKIFPKIGVMTTNQYRYGQYVVGNVFYNLGTDFQFGLEYLWGNRVNIGGEKGSANCIQSVVQFNF